MGRARDIANVLSSSTNIALDSELGLSLITPTSITATGGTGSISASGAVTFSGCTAISLNGCFVSTYQNYKVIATNLQGSAGGALNFRLRSSGTDTSSAYYGNNIYMLFTSTAVNGGATNNLSSVGISSTVGTANSPSFLTFEVGHPRDLTQVHITANSFQADSYVSLGSWKQQNNSSLAYDGFTLIPASGTLAGTIRVYGYRN